MAYTMRGELWRTWGDVPYPVEYGYDAQGRRTTMRTYRQALPWNDTSWPLAATGDVTTWEYDAASGLLSAKRDAAGQAVQYTYEAGGRLKTRRWARTVSGSPLVTTYNYQPQSGDLALVDYSDTTPDVTFAYDRLGRTKQVTDGSGVHTLAYDASSLALGSETRTGLVPATLTYKRASSGVVGRSTGVQLGSGYDVTYGYDAQGRVGSVGWSVSGQSDSATYARVAGSELLGGVTYASGLATTYGYEATRDLKTQVKNVAGGATVSQYDYQYDAVGRRGSVLNSGSAFAQSAFSKWQYNDRNELIESARYEGANLTDISRPVMEEYRAYGFDAIGNRTGASEAGTMKSYATNALNEYTAAGATLTYDVDGNLTSDGTRRFTYDAENRLASVEPVTAGSGSVRVKMAYDYLGRRVQKAVEQYDGSAWSAQGEARFVYMGWNVIEERRASSGVGTKKNFVWGLDLSQSLDDAGGIGGLLVVVDEQGSQMAFVYDAHGNVGQLVDEGGVVAKYEYDAFGQTLVASGVAANENARRFSTKYADEETGLVYYGYRYYWPEMGRWTNRDPSGEQHGANLLLMVSNDPINYGDPFGLYQYPTHFTISTNAVRAMPERCLCGWKTTLYAMPAYSIMNDQPEGFFAMKGILRDMDGPNRKLTQALAKDSITYRSHFGDLQIWHSMWDGFSDPTSLRARIVGHVLDRIEFARWKHDDGDDLGAAQELGFAVHAVEDSYSASHVARDSDGSVLTYQNYVTQSHSKHSFADFGVIDEQDRADTRRFYNSGQHVFSGTVSAATMAVNDLLQLMVCKKASEGQLRNYLEAEVYRHTSNTGVGTTETS